MEPSSQAAKRQSIRERYKAIRAACVHPQPEALARTMRTARERAWEHSAYVACYMGMGDELDPVPALTTPLLSEWKTCFPCLKPHSNEPYSNETDSSHAVPRAMELRSWRRGQQVVEGRFCKEPQGGQVVLVGDVGLVFVPGVVFDLQGGRLGYGYGYYDRFLKGYEGYKVGLAFEEQLTAQSLPLCEWDVRMDALCTPERFYGLG